MVNGFKGKKVLVTGGDGFIGANLIAMLESEGAEVYAVVRKHNVDGRLNLIDSQSTRVCVDLLDQKQIHGQLKEVGPEYVFHTATLRDEENWQDSFKINTISSLKLLQTVANPKLKKFIHFGSSFEYSHSTHLLKEMDPVVPNSFLGVCKASGTSLLQYFAKKQNLPIAILRIFHVYGPMESKHRLTSVAIRQILADEPISLTEPGYQHDFIFVSDLINACLKVADMDTTKENIFNIGTGKQTTNEEVVRLVGELIGKSPKVNVGDFEQRSWDKKNWCADVSLANKYLGWRPKTDLRSGLKKMLEYQLNFKK